MSHAGTIGSAPPGGATVFLGALLLSAGAFPGCTHKSPSSRLAAEGIFSDVSVSSGLDFRLESGARGDHHLIETMLGGLGWIDYDGDGDYDLYVANGHEDSLRGDGDGEATNVLYENDGRGRFHDVTRQAGVGDARYSNGVAVGDYDGDGDSDLLVTNFGRNTLYRNRGDGTFEDVTEAAGLVHTGWGTSAAWLDYDRDGDLDLYVTRYLEYQPGKSRRCVENGALLYCHPRFFPGQADLLYENEGDGRFREVGQRAEIARAGDDEGKGLGVIAADLDEDGWVDVYVANDTTPNFLWRNRGDGTFEDVAFARGVAVDGNGKSQAGMGVDWGDVNGDGHVDIHVTNFSMETNNLYLGGKRGEFFDGAQGAGLGRSYGRLGFGALLVDLDGDSHLDVFIVNGHVDDQVENSARARGTRYRQPPELFLNDGRGKFQLAAEDGGPVFGERFVGRALASSDMDGDGDVDLAIATLDRGVVLLRNNRRPRHYLTVRLQGSRSNRDAYGARVEVKFGGRRRAFEYQSARSYLAAVDPRLFIALGDAPRVDELTVHWPSGGTQVLRDLPANREVTITEPSR